MLIFRSIVVYIKMAHRGLTKPNALEDGAHARKMVYWIELTNSKKLSPSWEAASCSQNFMEPERIVTHSRYAEHPPPSSGVSPCRAE
jgi:hypothetical protein